MSVRGREGGRRKYHISSKNSKFCRQRPCPRPPCRLPPHRRVHGGEGFPAHPIAVVFFASSICCNQATKERRCEPPKGLLALQPDATAHA